MRKSGYFVALASLLVVLCSFGSLDVEKVKVTPEEIEADKASGVDKLLSPGFYGENFLYPKRRAFRFTSEKLSDSEKEAMIAKSGVKEERSKKYNDFCDAVESKLTPERRELIAQQRRLCEFCHIDGNQKIVVGLSKESAAEKGISALAYEYFNEWVDRMNGMVGETTDSFNVNFSFYVVFFDDNLRDPEKDVVIRML